MGLSPEEQQLFEENLHFAVEEDTPSQATLSPSRELPVLFKKPSADQAVGPPAQEPGDGILVSWANPGEESRHWMRDINQWIEAPLRVPIRIEDKDGQTHYVKKVWGKICVDLGPDSDRLNLSDAADVALFSTAASLAVARVRRLENDQRHLGVFRDFSQSWRQCSRPTMVWHGIERSFLTVEATRPTKLNSFTVSGAVTEMERLLREMAESVNRKFDDYASKRGMLRELQVKLAKLQWQSHQPGDLAAGTRLDEQLKEIYDSESAVFSDVMVKSLQIDARLRDTQQAIDSLQTQPPANV
ncbi:MAG: hypothetical protein ABI614_12120 [Planctomycetota bacterium]